MTAIYAGVGTAQSCFPQVGQRGVDVLGVLVSIEEPEPVGTQSPQLPQGLAGERHPPLEARCQQLPAGPAKISAPQPTSKHNIQTHHNRGEFPHWSFDARTDWGLWTTVRTPRVDQAFCVWTGASEHDFMEWSVGGASRPGVMELKAQAL